MSLNYPPGVNDKDFDEKISNWEPTLCCRCKQAKPTHFEYEMCLECLIVDRFYVCQTCGEEKTLNDDNECKSCYDSFEPDDEEEIELNDDQE